MNNKPSQGFRGTFGGNIQFISEEKLNNGHFLSKQRHVLGNREHKIYFNFYGIEAKVNSYQANKGTGNPTPLEDQLKY